MAILITYKMGEITKSNNNICINKLSCGFTCVILKCFSFYPLNNIVCGYYNILIINIFGPIQSKPHFIKGSKVNTSFRELLLLHHMGVNH